MGTMTGRGQEQPERQESREWERGYSYSRQPGGKGRDRDFNPLEVGGTAQPRSPPHRGRDGEWGAKGSQAGRIRCGGGGFLRGEAPHPILPPALPHNLGSTYPLWEDPRFPPGLGGGRPILS